MVNFPQRVYKPSRLEHVQVIRSMSFKQARISDSGFLAENKESTGSIICASKDNRPVVVGLQVSEKMSLVFNEKICHKIQKKVKEYMLKHKK